MQYIDNVIPWGSESILNHWADYADVVHIHSTIADCDMPHGIIATIKSTTRVVWDIHDLKEGDYALADAVIVPSNGYHRRVRGKNPNTHVIYSKSPKALRPPKADKDIWACCIPTALDGDVAFRDYREAAQLLKGEGIDLHVYSAEMPSKLKGELMVFEMLPQSDLYRRMSRYQYGWAGSANSRHDIDICVTNKLWDYLACGVHPITWRSKEMAEICRNFDVGSEWPSLNSGCRVIARDEFFLDGDKALFERAYQ